MKGLKVFLLCLSVTVVFTVSSAGDIERPVTREFTPVNNLSTMKLVGQDLKTQDSDHRLVTSNVESIILTDESGNGIKQSVIADGAVNRYLYSTDSACVSIEQPLGLTMPEITFGTYDGDDGIELAISTRSGCVNLICTSFPNKAYGLEPPWRCTLGCSGCWCTQCRYYDCSPPTSPDTIEEESPIDAVHLAYQ